MRSVNGFLVKADVDEAYELMLVIIGLVSAIMSSYPEYFRSYFTQYPEGFPIALAATRSLILPLVISLALWIVGKLIANLGHQAAIKMFAWMYALNMTVGDVFAYMIGSRWMPMGPAIGAGIGNIIFLLVVPSINYAIVLPKYKVMYPESKILRNKIIFVVASMAALILFLITAGMILISPIAAP